MVSTKTWLFRFQTVPIKIPFSIRLHQSSVGNRSSMTARIKCSVGSNIGIHLPPTFPKKNNFGEKASLFWFQTAPMKTPFSKPRPRSRNVKNPKIVLQYRHTCLLFHYFQEKIFVVSISNRSDKNSISISIQFHPLLRGGKWQDGRWSPLKQWSVTNCNYYARFWVEEGGSIRFDFRRRTAGQKRSIAEHDLWWRAAMRRVISVEIYWRYDNARDCSMPCTFHRTWLPVEQPRNRASTESRLSSRFEAAIPRVSPIESTISAASHIRNRGFFLSTCPRVYVGFHPSASCSLSCIERVIVRDSPQKRS